MREELLIRSVHLSEVDHIRQEDLAATLVSEPRTTPGGYK